jgi:hypothetical protein
MFARQTEQSFAVCLDVIAVQKPFALPGHGRNLGNTSHLWRGALRIFALRAEWQWV